MKKFDVIAMGELLIDFNNKSEKNKSVNSDNMLFMASPGGAPCNVLSMLQNLGKKTAFIGKVGKDMFGDFLVDAISSRGIDSSYVVRDSSVPTTLAFVHNDEDGDRSFSFYRNPGADMMLRIDEIDCDILNSTKIFHFGSLSMTDESICNTTQYLVDSARKAQCIISFDPNYRPLLWDDCNVAKDKMWYGISMCDILKIADDEISFLTGERDVDRGMECIFSKYKPLISCATLGKKGSIVYYKGKRVFAPAFIQNNTVDTTGAGDTFMACVLNFILENGIDKLDKIDEDELYKMLVFSNAAASLITTKKGALMVMPSKKEIYDLLCIINK